MKYFIITVDTEGDNLWDYKVGHEITTNNSLYIPRFQSLCEDFGFKPVWLTNYEMATDGRLVEYLRSKQELGLCEIGIHVHAWNNPPIYPLSGPYLGNPYLIEYPEDIMCKKFQITYDTITKNFGIPPVSHRAGRWAMNSAYFKLLEKFGILIDCSYTPMIYWKGMSGVTIPDGSDYRKVSRNSQWIGGVLEVPMTIRVVHSCSKGTLAHRVKSVVCGRNIWLRPSSTSLEDMFNLVDKVYQDNETDYLEFMIHSSELMPGGSPYFRDSKSIEGLYTILVALFNYIRNLGYLGITLKDYYQKCQ